MCMGVVSDPFPRPQAPQELVSLFSGSRQVVYGFVPHCTQATLKARIGSKHVETVVSTSDLGKTQGKVGFGNLVERVIPYAQKGVRAVDKALG